jgi:Replication-relaxation
MANAGNRLTATEKILIALAQYEYLTAQQVTRLLYSPGSLTYVQVKLKSLGEAELVLALGGRVVNLPRIYTLSSDGRQYAALLGCPMGRRFRPSEEDQKGQNLFFMRHSLAVNDVLIGAQLLSQTVPDIVLNCMVHERELKRKIYVSIPLSRTQGSGRRVGTVCIEPDCGLDFTIQEQMRDFFYIEVSRYLPVEWRWKQKVLGYVALTMTGQQEALFQTPALSVAVFTATKGMTDTLKKWTEEALHQHPEEGQRFFFSCVDPATASPAQMYFSPVWEEAFGTAPTPLLLLE